LDVSDHLKHILDTFFGYLGSFFEFLIVGISVKGKDVKRTSDTIATSEPVPDQNT